MAKIPIPFPSERERLRRQIEDEQNLTPGQRVRLVWEMLDMAAALNPQDDVFGSQDPLWLKRENDWQRRMHDLIQRQAKRIHG